MTNGIVVRAPIVILSAAKNLPLKLKAVAKRSFGSLASLRMSGERGAPLGMTNGIVVRAPHCHSERSEESFAEGSRRSRKDPSGRLRSLRMTGERGALGMTMALCSSAHCHLSAAKNLPLRLKAVAKRSFGSLALPQDDRGEGAPSG
jgi:hypothetical protein